jgi:hypothetical protein
MVGVEVGGWATSAFWSAGAAEFEFGVAGVEAEGVAVPEVDGGVGNGGAATGVEDGDAEPEGDAELVFGDVGAEELVGDVEGANLLLGDEGAGGAGAGECKGMLG